MRLLIDLGNTRLKWQLRDGEGIVRSGVGGLDVDRLFSELGPCVDSISGIAISTVASEDRCRGLEQSFSHRLALPVRFYWAEVSRGGLINAYRDFHRMGADRWHGMYGAWQELRGGFAVVDAGTAITVDYVAADGRHIGGYILPGLKMMLRSLQLDAARIGFDSRDSRVTRPGCDTSECVNHGLSWLFQSAIERIHSDVRANGLSDIIVTGGDAVRLLDLGLAADHRPSLVLEGLDAVDREEQAE